MTIQSIGELASIVAGVLALPPLWLLVVYLVSAGFEAVVAVIRRRLGATKAFAACVTFLAAVAVLFVALATALSLGDGSGWTPWAVGLLTTGFCYGVGSAIASMRSPETDLTYAGLWLDDPDETLDRSRSEEVSA